MGRRKRRYRRSRRYDPLVLEVEVERLALGGDGVGHVEQKVLFVSGGLPGDRVRVRVTEHASRFMRGEVVEVLRASPDRRSPRCPVAGPCGGCPWMALEDPAQWHAREEIVRETLARVGKVPREVVAPILPAPAPFGYRNRLRMVALGKRIGFRSARSRRVVDVARCEVARPELNALLARVRMWMKPRLPISSPLQIEMAIQEDGALNLAVSGTEAGLFEGFPDGSAPALEANGPPPVNQDSRLRPTPLLDPLPVEVRLDADPLDPRGRPRLGFTQANDEQNRRMIALVHEALQVRPGHRVLDLYAGDGNLSAGIAPLVRHVVGVDIDAEAAATASARTGINARYLAGDVHEMVRSLIDAGQTFDRIILDPPRSGARKVCPLLEATGATRVVYVSCNPATLARDLRTLVEAGFRVAKVTPVDLFPQTAHVECVAVLERRFS